MKIRINQPTTAHLDLQPGDELLIQHLSPGLEALLSIARLDGTKAAEIVANDDEEVADAPAVAVEKAVTGRARGPRATALP